MDKWKITIAVTVSLELGSRLQTFPRASVINVIYTSPIIFRSLPINVFSVENFIKRKPDYCMED